MTHVLIEHRNLFFFYSIDVTCIFSIHIFDNLKEAMFYARNSKFTTENLVDVGDGSY